MYSIDYLYYHNRQYWRFPATDAQGNTFAFADREQAQAAADRLNSSIDETTRHLYGTRYTVADLTPDPALAF